ncbi:MAG: hypothetical protein CXT73_05190 [Methanobacteriota archaeon]|nr:MAG: hypothetical protein CXT73_05190 [Euryarchaeota archaeon]
MSHSGEKKSKEMKEKLKFKKKKDWITESLSELKEHEQIIDSWDVTKLEKKYKELKNKSDLIIEQLKQIKEAAKAAKDSADVWYDKNWWQMHNKYEKLWNEGFQAIFPYLKLYKQKLGKLGKYKKSLKNKKKKANLSKGLKAYDESVAPLSSEDEEEILLTRAESSATSSSNKRYSLPLMLQAPDPSDLPNPKKLKSSLQAMEDYSKLNMKKWFEGGNQRTRKKRGKGGTQSKMESATSISTEQGIQREIIKIKTTIKEKEKRYGRLFVKVNVSSRNISELSDDLEMVNLIKELKDLKIKLNKEQILLYNTHKHYAQMKKEEKGKKAHHQTLYIKEGGGRKSKYNTKMAMKFRRTRKKRGGRRRRNRKKSRNKKRKSRRKNRKSKNKE